jgi:hypothetical protein
MRQSSIAQLRFSLLLPLLELTVWAILVPLQAAISLQQVGRINPGSDTVRIQSGSFETLVPRHRLFAFTLERTAYLYSRPISAANLPGSVLQLSIPSSRRPWHPSNMPYESWRCIVLPFFCFPAWWLIGFALKIVLNGKRFPQWLLISGFILCALFIIGFVGFRFGPEHVGAERYGLGVLGIGALGRRI